MYIKREIERRFEQLQQSNTIIAVVGARQAGKTTLLKEHIKGRGAAYILFDDPDARTLFEEDVKRFERQYMESADVTVLDEVQYCADAGAKLKYLFEHGRRMWITSSSEMILRKEILSYLVGRVSILRLYPFSLTEFLLARGQKELTPASAKRAVWEHALYGGYPKIVLTDDRELKTALLRDLYETMMLKDMAQAFSIEDIRGLEELARSLAINTGAVLSYASISQRTTLSFQTIRKYLDAMEKSYLIVRIRPFFRNKNKEITKQPKVYFVDTGLRNAVAAGVPAEVDGPLFENYVLTELLKAGFSPTYWRTKGKAEVDFVIENEGEIIPIEAKRTATRVERSLHLFIEQYTPKRAFVVVYQDVAMVKKVLGCSVVFTGMTGLLEMLREPGKA